jgi:ABC-2 type transport system permease protein
MVTAAFVARRTVRSGLGWGLGFGLYVFYAVYTYAAEYPTIASRVQIGRSLGASSGLQALLGPARSLGTMAGFTEWRSVGLLTLLGAVWGLATATRWLRGEEEAGRWEVLLAGQTTRPLSVIQVIAGLAAGWLALWATTAALVLVAGMHVDPPLSVGESLYFALTLTSGAALFLAIGALVSQLAGTRRQALIGGAWVLGITFLIRMVADSGASLAGARWASPLGWIEELQPLTGAQPLVVIPIAALAGVVAALAVVLAAKRDLGAGWMRASDTGRARLALMRGPAGLALRLERSVAVGWLVAIAIVAAVGALMAKSVASGASSTVGSAFSRLGAQRPGADAFLGVIFLLLAVILLMAVTGQVAASWGEEADGRLDNLLVRPVARLTWLVERLAVSLAMVLACGLMAGVMAWLGAASQHADVTLSSLIQAGINIMPPAVFLLGLGTLVYGLWPRLAAPICYGVVAWSFMVQVIGSIATANPWLLDTSLLHHMALAPAADPDWTSAAALLCIGVVAAALGGVAFSRRDLLTA